MQKENITKNLLLIIFILFIVIYIGYSFVNNKIEDLKVDQYSEVAFNMKNQLTTLIEQKEDALSYISLTMVQNEQIKQALKENNHTLLHLDLCAKKLTEHTNLKDVWFQVVNVKGQSFYKSWTKKRLENILNIRRDLAKTIKTPKVVNGISVGKYNITFKSIVPVYDQQSKFLGLFETITQFNSIIQNMMKNSYEVVLIVDHRYSKQLTLADKSHFIDGYFIPNNSSSVKILKNQVINKLLKALDESPYILYPQFDRIATLYKLYDTSGKAMAYAILMTKLSDINMQDIYDMRNDFIVFSALLIFGVFGFLYYLYVRENTKLITIMNEKLEKKVLQKTASLESIAYHDFLTRLPNRFKFSKTLETLITDNFSEICVIFLDLDNFKDINDNYGHLVGDKLLKVIAKRLSGLKEMYDNIFIARLGGDEFTILLKDSKKSILSEILEDVQILMNESIKVDEHSIEVTFSMGLSKYPKDGKNADELIRNADIAMYEAKEAGRNRYMVYNTHMSKVIAQRLQLTKKLKEALDNKEFMVYFQPQVNAQTNSVIGAEALIRWIHPQDGMIRPDEFMPLAEDIGLITQIDEWMLLRASQYYMQLRSEGIEHGSLSLNLSTKQLATHNFVNRVEEILAQTGFDINNLEFEILEGQIVENEQDSIIKLSQLKYKGAKIVVDDFGTGYSSLSYIKKLPISKLKIDKSFIDLLPEDDENRAIVLSIITIAKHLCLEIIAEGVEDRAQKNFLVDSGCVNIQGYFYSKPLSDNDFKNYLKKFIK